MLDSLVSILVDPLTTSIHLIFSGVLYSSFQCASLVGVFIGSYEVYFLEFIPLTMPFDVFGQLVFFRTKIESP